MYDSVLRTNIDIFGLPRGRDIFYRYRAAIHDADGRLIAKSHEARSREIWPHRSEIL